MTNEEAKNLINKMSRVSKAKEAARIANAAIEKQIPKGLTIQAGVYPEMGTYICPNCGRLFGYVMYGTEALKNAEINYCPRCGQAIKYESQKLNYADADTAQSGLQSAT